MSFENMNLVLHDPLVNSVITTDPSSSSASLVNVISGNILTASSTGVGSHHAVSNLILPLDRHRHMTKLESQKVPFSAPMFSLPVVPMIWL